MTITPASEFPFHNPANFLASPPRLSPGLTAGVFFGCPYEQNTDICNNLISILSGSHIQAKFPYYFSLKPLGCYMLLYTESGYGKLHTDDSIYSLASNSLLFLKCDSPFKIEIAVSPWNYAVFFIKGHPLDFYYRSLPADTFSLFTLPEYSSVIKDIGKLSTNDIGSSIRNKLTDHRLLTDIFTGLLLENIEKDSQQKKIPSYLLEMKAHFDLDYQQKLSLDELEEHFSISKYRLCREFHACFGQSPLQYLNEKRIDIAKDLLLTTDYRIYEIGSLVGIDNTNHFIYLFKKYTRLTPLAFRRKEYND